MYMYSDILPNSGGTQVCLDSIQIVAEFFAAHPEGVSFPYCMFVPRLSWQNEFFNVNGSKRAVFECNKAIVLSD